MQASPAWLQTFLDRLATDDLSAATRCGYRYGERRPRGLTAAEVHGLLRAAGASSHGLARRNHALVQLMLQTGLRIGEMAALRRGETSFFATAPARCAFATARASRNARCP